MENLDMTNDHQAIEMLLPWFITKTLNVDEMAQVDQHLADCHQCRALLAQEQQLQADFADIPVAVPLFGPPNIDNIELRPNLSRNWRATKQILTGWVAKPGRVLTFAVAQAAMLLLMFQLVQPAALPDAKYRTLSSGEVTGEASANAIVIFNGDTLEKDFRSILVDADATIVGGPNDANAYMLRIDGSKRDSVLEKLRANRQIVLVQPIDQE